MMVKGELVINPQFEWAGGGFATSPLDLARWGRELYAGRALLNAARTIMLDAAVPARLGPETKYGLGVIVRPVTPVGLAWGHIALYQTELIHLPIPARRWRFNQHVGAASDRQPEPVAAYDIAAMTKPGR
jgi:D-alanyl-D-alanine carboxypeptidase